MSSEKWDKLETIIKKHWKWIKENKHGAILLTSVILYTVTMTTLTYYKYYCFKSNAFDMGIFIQIFWNTINGRPMYTQPRGSSQHPTNFFGVHFSPFLYLLMPIYKLFPSTITLLLLQALLLSATSIVLYRIARILDWDKNTALVFAVLFLIYPGTLWSNWYDFHLEAFTPLSTALVYYNYLKENKIGILASTILLSTVMERNLFISIAFAGYFTLREAYHWKTGRQRNKAITPLLIASILVFSTGYFFYSEHYIESYAVNRSPSTLQSITGIITYNNILAKIAYIVFLAAPLAFLQLDAPLELIPAGPYLALVAITGYSPYYEITWQYPALVSTPFFISAITGAKKNRTHLTAKLVILSLCFFTLFSPGAPLMTKLSNSWKLSTPDENTHLKNQALNMIPDNATVLAQENIFPNLATRETIYSLWPVNQTPPEYIVFDLKDYFLYYTPSEEPLDEYLNTTVDMYGVYASIDGFTVLKRGYSEAPKMSKELRLDLEYGETRTRYIKYEKSFAETNFYIPEWVDADKNGLHIESRYNLSLWWGPYILLPPGEYQIDVELTAEEPIDEPILIIQCYSIPAGRYGEWSINPENNTHVSETIPFTLNHWVPEFEVVGRNLGNANYTITRVTLRGDIG